MMNPLFGAIFLCVALFTTRAVAEPRPDMSAVGQKITMVVVGQGYDSLTDQVRIATQRMIEALLTEGQVDYAIGVVPSSRAVEQLSAPNSICLITRKNTAQRLGLSWAGPIYATEDVLISRPGLDVKFERIEDARSYRIGVIANGAQADKLKAAGIVPDVAPASQLNLKKLLAGRIDLRITQSWIARMLVGEVLATLGLHVAYASPTIEDGIGCNAPTAEPTLQKIEQAVVSFHEKHKAGMADFY